MRKSPALTVAIVTLAFTVQVCAARTPEEIFDTLQTAQHELRQAAPNLQDIFDAGKRPELAPKVIGPMKTQVNCYDELMAVAPTTKRQAISLKMPLQAMLMFLDDADTLAAVQAAAKDADAATATSARISLLLCRWWRASNDAAAQGKVVDNLAAMAKADPKEDLLAAAVMMMSQSGAAAPELQERVKMVLSQDSGGQMTAEPPKERGGRTWLGATLADGETGVLVLRTLPGSPADGKLLQGDIISGWNGREIKTKSELIKQIRNTAPNTEVTFEIVRIGKNQELRVRLGEQPEIVANLFDGDSAFQKKDYSEAMRCYRKAADAGDPDGTWNVGRMYENGFGVPQDDAEALKWYRKAADAGEPDGMNNVGLMYANGKGVPKDNAEAVKWFRKAADAGGLLGMRNLGFIYETGLLGVPQDAAEAVKWYRKGAEAWDTSAMLMLGAMYADGKGAPKDGAEAVRWFRKAAESGNTLAMMKLATMYADGEGVPNDDAEAVKWSRKAAEAGQPLGMAMLGALYADGEGVAQDYAQAMTWYRKAADAGDPEAMNNVGALYADGEGVAPDYAQAMTWWRKAADAGVPTAMTSIGLLYARGKGVAQDDAEAVKWFQKAAEAGNPWGMNNLGQMYYVGRGVRQDDAEAAKWFRKGAEAGDADGMFDLGVMYYNGRGVTKDAVEATKWFREAAAAGNDAAKKALSDLAQANGAQQVQDAGHELPHPVDTPNAADTITPEQLRSMREERIRQMDATLADLRGQLPALPVGSGERSKLWDSIQATWAKRQEVQRMSDQEFLALLLAERQQEAQAPTEAKAQQDAGRELDNPHPLRLGRGAQQVQDGVQSYWRNRIGISDNEIKRQLWENGGRNGVVIGGDNIPPP